MIFLRSAIMVRNHVVCRLISLEDGIGFLLVGDAEYDLIRRTLLLIQCIRFMFVFTGCWKRQWLESCFHDPRSFPQLGPNSIAQAG